MKFLQKNLGAPGVADVGNQSHCFSPLLVKSLLRLMLGAVADAEPRPAIEANRLFASLRLAGLLKRLAGLVQSPANAALAALSRSVLVTFKVAIQVGA